MSASPTCIINNKMLKQFYGFRKMKNMYQILKPVIFTQLTAESFQIILHSCMILKVHIINYCHTINYKNILSQTNWIYFVF